MTMKIFGYVIIVAFLIKIFQLPYIIVRQWILLKGEPAIATLIGGIDTGGTGRRNFGRYRLKYSYEINGRIYEAENPVSYFGFPNVSIGTKLPVHISGTQAFLDDDFGFTLYNLLFLLAMCIVVPFVLYLRSSRRSQ